MITLPIDELVEFYRDHDGEYRVAVPLWQLRALHQDAVAYKAECEHLVSRLAAQRTEVGT